MKVRRFWKCEGGACVRKIVITTESGADIPKDLADKYEIQIVPMHVVMDGVDYLDGQLPVTEVFEYHNRTKKIPSTSATNVHEYEKFFEEIQATFPNCIILHVGYTSRASASFQAAIIAAEQFKDIHLVDALNVTGGLGAIVLHTAKLLHENPTLTVEQLIAEVERVTPKTRLAFLPGSLDYLKAGGRVSNLAYLGGAILKIKPCIELVDGKLTSTRKYRGEMKDAVEKLLKDYLAMYNLDRQQVYLIYSIGLAEPIKNRIEEIVEEAGFESIRWLEAGAMISTHAGPGGFGIAAIEQ